MVLTKSNYNQSRKSRGLSQYANLRSLGIIATRTVPKDSIKDWETSVVDPSDKILNAGWVYFILRPVFEQKSLDMLEEDVVDDGGLDIVVGCEVWGQSCQVTTEQVK